MTMLSHIDIAPFREKLPFMTKVAKNSATSFHLVAGGGDHWPHSSALTPRKREKTFTLGPRATPLHTCLHKAILSKLLLIQSDLASLSLTLQVTLIIDQTIDTIVTLPVTLQVTLIIDNERVNPYLQPLASMVS